MSYLQFAFKKPTFTIEDVAGRPVKEKDNAYDIIAVGEEGQESVLVTVTPDAYFADQAHLLGVDIRKVDVCPVEGNGGVVAYNLVYKPTAGPIFKGGLEQHFRDGIAGRLDTVSQYVAEQVAAIKQELHLQ